MRYLTLMALVLALLIPNVASAQKGKGGGGSSHGGGGGGGGNWSHGGNGSWDGNWNGNRGYYGGYYGNSWLYPFIWGGYGYGYGWPNYYYDSPGYSYYPDTVYDSSPRTSTYYDPMLEGSNSNPPSPNRAMLEILVPDSNAELLIQNQRMSVMGNRRIFVSPDLEQGKTYTYTITFKRNISGRTEDDTRQIDVQAGTRNRVDFTRPQTNNMPAPQPK